MEPFEGRKRSQTVSKATFGMEDLRSRPGGVSRDPLVSSPTTEAKPAVQASEITALLKAQTDESQRFFLG